MKARQLSRATMSNIRQNLVFAFVDNVAGIPVAAGVLYPVFGWLLREQYQQPRPAPDPHEGRVRDLGEYDRAFGLVEGGLTEGVVA